MRKVWPHRPLAHYSRDPAPVARVIVMGKQAGTGAQPVLCLADNGRQYWVKFSNSGHGPEGNMMESLVSSLGAVIDAPVVQTVQLAVAPELVGKTYSETELLRVPDDVASGSPVLPAVGAVHDEVTNVRRDNNRYRSARFVALWDWMVGDDIQLLFSEDDGGSMWTFDHGLWMGQGAGPLDMAALNTLRGDNRTFSEPGVGALDPGRLTEAATALEQVEVSDVVQALTAIPRSWAPDEALLTAIGECLWDRIPGSADRIRQIASQITRSKGRRG